MKMRKRYAVPLLAVLFIVPGYIYLKYSDDPDDKMLYSFINPDTGYVYFKNDSSIRQTSGETERAHDNFMRIRFNGKAASVLDSTGSLKEGTAFPDSSVIVKEVYSDKDNKSPDILAVMVRLKGNKNSSKGWLWAEYTPGGDVEYSVTKKGKVCVACHKSEKDYVRIFDIVK